ncbi:MAG: squalene synthase HpnC [Rhizobiales bacterium]|nr:squalene synthase HpnC [Rhizobacter sp.]
MSVDHYENFPVASILCPPALRPAVAAIYHFARTADDIADEGEATPGERLADLGAYRADLAALCDGAAVSPRWPQVFGPLRPVLAAHALPVGLLTDLLSAFEQDVVKTTYADRVELLDYCRRSANPVGRLLLHLYGVHAALSLRQSDAICSALQLANFWQDLGVDTRRGRVYVPATDCARRGVAANELLAHQDTPQGRALVADMVEWARDMMLTGAPLVHAVPGRAGWELRLVVQGGLRILEKIAALNFATLHARPTLRWYDAPLLVWRALWMRPAAALITSKSA